MSKPLRVVIIDGTRGSGKSSQIHMLSRQLTKALPDAKVMITSAGKDIPTGVVAMDKITAYLEEDPNNMVIVDGSIARMMVSDLIIGRSNNSVIDDYKHLTHRYERLDHKYGVACLLMVMDDLEECKKRLEKKGRFTGAESDSNFDAVKEVDIVTAMRFFNNHIASKNINFKVIDIEHDDTMMEVNKDIVRILEERFEIKLTKKDDNDW